MMQRREEQPMARWIPAVGSVKRRRTQKKTHFSARMAEMAKSVPTGRHSQHFKLRQLHCQLLACMDRQLGTKRNCRATAGYDQPRVDRLVGKGRYDARRFLAQGVGERQGP
jgi:hypothetical protein